MAGAARLAGEACLRSGAGRVTVATRAANVAAITAGRPELMTCAVESSEDLGELLKKIDLIAIGPGLGQDAWAQSVFAAAMGAGKPLVVDADALDFVAKSGVYRDDWILTPHPGEAARLLGTTPALIQADRVVAARKLAERYGGIAVLKGAGTLVYRSGAVPQVCDYGNPGMATAGMGDVLTGVIAAMVAQTPDLWTAARAGVLVHAMAGDAAARRGERGLLAGDVIAHLAACVNPTR
jgi:NAD(P)H-hydrate epimerase